MFLERNMRTATLATAFFIVVLGTTAPANVRAANDNQQDSSDRQSGPLQEIVVTATRREENLSKVPISVSAYTQESMDQKGIKDISDVARFTPGVVVDANGTDSISIRGISSSGGA